MQKLSRRGLFQNAGAVSAGALICYPADMTRSYGRKSPCPLVPS